MKFPALADWIGVVVETGLSAQTSKTSGRNDSLCFNQNGKLCFF